MSDRVLRGHRVIGRRAGNPDWRDRRRRAERLARTGPEFRTAGLFASPPEERLPIARFTITPDSVWSQPGGYSSDEALSVRIRRGEESDAA